MHTSQRIHSVLFLSACALGVDVIETDVHLSKDGQLVIWHDETLDRNTDGSGGRVEDHTLAELKTYDAGYTFTPDNGKTFPFRGGKGVQLCTLQEALEACPNQRFNVDLKSNDPAIVDTFIEVIHSMHATKRIVAASFHLSNLKLLRKKALIFKRVLPRLRLYPPSWHFRNFIYSPGRSIVSSSKYLRQWVLR